MKLQYSLILGLFLCGSNLASAQNTPFSYQKSTEIVTPVYQIFDPMLVTDNWIHIQEPAMPLPGGMKESMRKKVDAERARKNRINRRGNYTSDPTNPQSIAPVMIKGYDGASGGGTPNDNHIAVGNDGKFINVLNTVIRVHDDTGKIIRSWSLENFIYPQNKKIDPIPVLTRVYDPRVLYDPYTDRYIVLYMHGTTDQTSFIVVGFSSSSNPVDPWYVYKIPGKPTKDSVWSDYPIVTHNREDMFFTVNLIGNNATWEEGFTEAVIWQLRKEDGFAGDSLHKNVYTGIKHQGKSLRSICAVQNSPMPDGTDNYFVTVRPIDQKNDTVFLLRVTNTQKSGLANLEMQLMKSDLPYGFPPSALQPDTSYKLRTNDARALSAIRMGNTVQYMQNSINFETYQAHLTYNTIFNIHSNPFIKASMLTDDSLDMGYPAIVSAGSDENDPSSVVAFVYSSPWHFPGTAVVYKNRYGELSSIQNIKSGKSLIYYSFIPKGEQRWGDYSGMQAKFNEPGVFYLVGSYGDQMTMKPYCARIKLTDAKLNSPVADVKIFPIPSISDIRAEIKTTVEGEFSFRLVNMNGQIVKEKKSVYLHAGTHLLTVADNTLSNGVYELRVMDPSGKIIHTQKIIAN